MKNFSRSWELLIAGIVLTILAIVVAESVNPSISANQAGFVMADLGNDPKVNDDGLQARERQRTRRGMERAKRETERAKREIERAKREIARMEREAAKEIDAAEVVLFPRRGQVATERTAENSSARSSTSSPAIPYTFLNLSGKLIDASEVDVLHIQLDGGHITLLGQEEVDRMDFDFRRDGKSLSKEEIESSYKIEFKVNGNQADLTISKKNTSFWNNGGGITLNALVPPSLNVSAQTDGGHLTAEHLTGKITLETKGGHITGNDLKGEQKFITRGGHITIKNAEGKAEYKTYGGHVSVDHFVGALKATTNGGHLSFEDFSGQLVGHTNGGNINANFKAISGDVDLSTNAGNVSVAIPRDARLNLDARGMKVDLDGELSSFKGTHNHKSIDGSLNGGGSDLKVKTNVGKVYINIEQ